MSKIMLRFCVLIYKGLMFIVKNFMNGFKVLFGLFNGNNTSKVIARENAKQMKIANSNSKILIDKDEKTIKKNIKKQTRKNARIARLEERARKKIEKRALAERNRLFKANKRKGSKIGFFKKIDEKKALKEKEKLAKLEAKMKTKIAKEKLEEAELRNELEKNLKKKKNIKVDYRNENVIIKKVTLKDRFINFIKNIKNLPKNIEKSIYNKWSKTSFAKNKRNKLDLNRKALLVEFEDKNAEQSDVKVMYEYVVKDENGKVIKGHTDGFSKAEVHSYLLSEGYEVYSIRTNKWIQFAYSNRGNDRVKVKTKDLIFFTTQLSTYLKSGITLIESLKILSRQYNKTGYKKIFKAIIYDLSRGENFSTSLENRGRAFPNLLITMVRSSEMTGELPEALDDMSDYYTEAEKTRKQMITAMMYPTIVFIFAIMVLTFIMLYVIPKFVDIYDTMDGVEIPGITQFIMNLSNFMQKNILFIALGVVIVIVIFNLLYKKNKSFRTAVQWFLMHVPIVKNIIIYKEVTMFTKTFASLLMHNVYITDSMQILIKVTQNEIYRSIVFNTVTNLARGERLSSEFEGHWAFPIPAYEMIVTGERTGQLPEMMSKVSAYYQELHQNTVTRIKTFIEPVLIIFLTAMVGIIVLSIVLPMFSMYQSIQTV